MGVQTSPIRTIPVSYRRLLRVSARPLSAEGTYVPDGQGTCDLLVTDTYGERPRLMGLLNARLGKAASALIGRWGGFWEPGRSDSAVDLLDRNAVNKNLACTSGNLVS